MYIYDVYLMFYLSILSKHILILDSVTTIYLKKKEAGLVYLEMKEFVIYVIPTPLAMNFIIYFSVTFSTTRENNVYLLSTVLEIPAPSLSVLLCVKLMEPNCLNYVVF